jgi:predicted chitinase
MVSVMKKPRRYAQTRKKRKSAINNTSATHRKKRTAIAIRRSSGRNEKFDIKRMIQITGRSGVPFPMAMDIAKDVSKKVRAETKGQENRIVTARKIRSLIAASLIERNQQAIASSFSGDRPENTQKNDTALKVKPSNSPVTSGKTNSVMHDRSKRLASAA